MIFGGRPDRLLKVSFAFLWLAFLLFPIAHLSIGDGIPMYWSEIAVGVSCLAFLLHDPKQARARLGGLLREELLFFLCVGIFLGGIIFAYVLNPHSLSGWGEIKSFYLVPILFLIAILIHAETKERIELLASGWLLGLTAASSAGAIAYMLGWFTYDGRLTSLYLSPNYLAMLVAPGILLSAYFLTALFTYRYRLVILCSGCFMLFALWATHSYAAWAAVLSASVAGVYLLRASQPLRYIALLLGLIIFLGGILFHERGTEKWQSLVSGSERSSLASRIMIWRAAVKMVEDSFPVGIGTGRFQTVYLENQAYFPTYLEWAVPTPHNLYLHFLLEGGVLALVGWLGCIFLLVRRGYRTFSQRSDRHIVVLGFMLVLLYLVYGLIDTPYMKNDLALAIWGSLGFYLGSLRVRA